MLNYFKIILREKKMILTNRKKNLNKIFVNKNKIDFQKSYSFQIKNHTIERS
jgi:hypothetical protein